MDKLGCGILNLGQRLLEFQHFHWLWHPCMLSQAGRAVIDDGLNVRRNHLAAMGSGWTLPVAVLN